MRRTTLPGYLDPNLLPPQASVKSSAIMMAETPAFITMPQSHGKKNNKVNKANRAMVLNSLAPTLPIVVPEAASHLEDSSRSTPNSPEREEGKKSKGFIKKHLSRPRSPRHHHHRKSHSDPESTSPSPQPRPKLLFNRNKKRPQGFNGSTSEQQSNHVSGGYRATEPEATPVEELPGRTHHPNCTSSDVPEIRVSSEAHDERQSGGMVSYEEISGSLDPNVDPYRKNSQSSRCSSGSGLMSVGTSGFGSLLSPSGDESSSDLESPLSPYSPGSYSPGSSFTTEDTPGDISDLDPIDKDYVVKSRSPSFSGQSQSGDNLSVTTPTPTSESPPNMLDSSVVTLVSPTSPDGKELKDRKKKKDKSAKVGVCVVLWVWHRE